MKSCGKASHYFRDQPGQKVSAKARNIRGVVDRRRQMNPGALKRHRSDNPACAEGGSAWVSDEVSALRYSSSFCDAKVTPQVLAEYLATSKKRRRGGNKHVRQLTCRQREVLQLLAEGNSSRDVGAALKISTSTAETHRANIMRKIGCQSAAGLVRYAIRNHMVQE